MDLHWKKERSFFEIFQKDYFGKRGIVAYCIIFICIEFCN